MLSDEIVHVGFAKATKGLPAETGSLDFLRPATAAIIASRLLNAKQQVEINCLSLRTVAEMAEIAMLSEFYFLRLFKKVYRITPYQYLTRLKLEQARELLLTGASVRQVSLTCGYTDAFTFSKAFKRHFRTAPKHFVRQHESTLSLKTETPEV